MLSSADALSAASSDKKAVSHRYTGKAVTPRELTPDYEPINEMTESDKEEKRTKNISSVSGIAREELRQKNPFSTTNIEKQFAKLADGQPPLFLQAV